MVTIARQREVDAADAFLANAKTLDGPPPIWRDSLWGSELAALWIVLDSDGAPSGQLRFRALKTDTLNVGLSLIHAGRPLWRIDLDERGPPHPNPPDAHALGLTATVPGSHEHAWVINRAYVLSQDQWPLRYRRPIPRQIRRLGQALLWLAPQINLTVDPSQHGFDGPNRLDLFDRSGQ